MYALMNVIKGIRMTEKSLFGMTSKRNSVYPLLHVFLILLVYPCCMIRNPSKFDKSALSNLLGCRKDVFYRFMENAPINWSKLLYHINLQLWNKIRVRSDHKGGTTCLMVDDTDYPKTGRRMENIGRIYSQVQHKSILGFKALFLGITDGVSQMLLDFALLGEKRKKGNYGMSGKELEHHFTRERDGQTAVQGCVNEYSMSKIALTISMIKRAVSKGIRFRYVLADSWFACGAIIRFIHSRHIPCHYLGMIKVGENGRTKYHFQGNDYTAPALIKLLSKRKQKSTAVNSAVTT